MVIRSEVCEEHDRLELTCLHRTGFSISPFPRAVGMSLTLKVDQILPSLTQYHKLNWDLNHLFVK